MKKFNLKKVFIFLSLVLVGFSATMTFASAANLKDAFKVRDKRICADNDILDCAANGAGYDVSAVTNGGSNDTIEPIISTIITSILSLLGVILLVLMVYGGFLWMTAAGDEKKVEKAKSLITSAVIGLIIVLLAYAISMFVVTKFSGTLK